jgi:hypothetical protein
MNGSYKEGDEVDPRDAVQCDQMVLAKNTDGTLGMVQVMLGNEPIAFMTCTPENAVKMAENVTAWAKEFFQ